MCVFFPYQIIYSLNIKNLVNFSRDAYFRNTPSFPFSKHSINCFRILDTSRLDTVGDISCKI